MDAMITISRQSIPMAINVEGIAKLEDVDERFIRITMPFSKKVIAMYWSRIAPGYWRIRIGWMV
jgi:hypothetical protein